MTPYEQKQQLIRQDAAFVAAVEKAYPQFAPVPPPEPPTYPYIGGFSAQFQLVPQWNTAPKNQDDDNWKSMKQIAFAVAKQHGVSVADIRGRLRLVHINLARQQAMYEMMATGRWSTTAIGRYLDRDHTTVLHGADAHAKRTGAPYIGGKVKGRKR